MAFSWLLALISIPTFASTFDLHDSAIYAINHSPTLDSSERNLIISDLNRKNAAAVMLPSLDLTSSHGLQRNYPQVDPNEPYASSLSLSLTETLYDNGEALNKHRSAVVQEEASRLTTDRDRDQLLLAVSNAYYDLCLAKKNLEIRQEQHAVLKLQVELVKESYRQGVKTRQDYLRFLTQLNRSDIDLLTFRDNVTKGMIDLKRAMGVPVDNGEQINFAIDETRPIAIEPADIKIEGHRDYKIAQLQERVADLNTELIHRRQFPAVGLTMGGSYGTSDYMFTGQGFGVNQRINWNALVSLNYNFFDFGTRRRNTEIAAQQAAVQANTLTGSLLDLKQQIEKLQIDLRQLIESFRLSEELFRLEKTNLALITNQYRQGKVQYLDYINSLQNFASARSTYYTSLYGLRKSQLLERYHEGTLYEAIQGN
jgi:outer membrane protein